MDSDEYEIDMPTYRAAKFTRRTLLAHVSSTFDPFGLLAPAVLPAKLFQHKVWQSTERLGWDQELPDKLLNEWSPLAKAWEGQKFTLRRKYSQFDLSNPNVSKELHVFSDASMQAMGTAVYLRTEYETKVDTSLIFGKSLVKPSAILAKNSTIPKLELHAFTIATRIADFVARQLKPEFNISHVQFWTDSADVVDWTNQLKHPEGFIERRLEKLRNRSIMHIDGTENPADIASRGCTPKELNDCRFWFEGPSWLGTSKSTWKGAIRTHTPSKIVKFAKPDRPLFELSLATTDSGIDRDPIFDIKRFSKWSKLLRTVAYVNRFIDHAKGKGKPGTQKDIIRPDELKWAETLIVRQE